VLGVDTNILVRFFTRDDQAQFDSAARLIADATDGSLFISVVVLAELNWVLARAYDVPRKNLLLLMNSLLEMREFTVEAADRVRLALNMAGEQGCDFVDALIAYGNVEMGCTATVSFDKKALRMKQFVALEDVLS
jgi:predicted nucleic-acid-binding protein